MTAELKQAIAVVEELGGTVELVHDRVWEIKLNDTSTSERARTQKGVMPKAIDGIVGRSSNA